MNILGLWYLTLLLYIFIYIFAYFFHCLVYILNLLLVIISLLHAPTRSALTHTQNNLKNALLET